MHTSKILELTTTPIAGVQIALATVVGVDGGFIGRGKTVQQAIDNVFEIINREVTEIN